MDAPRPKRQQPQRPRAADEASGERGPDATSGEGSASAWARLQKLERNRIRPTPPDDWTRKDSERP